MLLQIEDIGDVPNQRPGNAKGNQYQQGRADIAGETALPFALDKSYQQRKNPRRQAQRQGEHDESPPGRMPGS